MHGEVPFQAFSYKVFVCYVIYLIFITFFFSFFERKTNSLNKKRITTKSHQQVTKRKALNLIESDEIQKVGKHLSKLGYNGLSWRTERALEQPCCSPFLSERKSSKRKKLWSAKYLPPNAQFHPQYCLG